MVEAPIAAALHLWWNVQDMRKFVACFTSLHIQLFQVNEVHDLQSDEIEDCGKMLKSDGLNTSSYYSAALPA